MRCFQDSCLLVALQHSVGASLIGVCSRGSQDKGYQSCDQMQVIADHQTPCLIAI